MAETCDITIWHPAEIFSERPKSNEGFALIVLNLPLENKANFYSIVWDNAVFHVGADGGANRVYQLNQSNEEDQDFLDLDTVIGDLDSILPDVKEYWQIRGSEIICDPDQYSTDFQKAVKYIRSFEVPSRGSWIPSSVKLREGELQKIKEGSKTNDIVCIGGLGGRVDQAMSTLHHLYHFQEEPDYALGRLFLLSTEAITFVLKTGKHKIKVRESFPGMALGNHIGILPLKEPSNIWTKGLRWDVENWPTAFYGQMSTSNQVAADWVEIYTTKDVLFTIDLDFSSDQL